MILQQKINIKNKRASFDYEFIEKYVAGLVLLGTEIKSIRLSKVSMNDAYCHFIAGELYHPQCLNNTWNAFVHLHPAPEHSDLVVH